MHYPHDAVFKDLINNRAFAVDFLKNYMPAELAARVNWSTVQLDTANVEHTRQQHKTNLKNKEQSDLTFLFQFNDQKDGAVFVHIEHQTTNEASLLIRTRHYQTAYLLDYIKRHKPAHKLPLVVSIIYYANSQPFSHSLNINDYFQNQDLAEQHAFAVKLIELTQLNNTDIAQHGRIAGYEFILKAIQQKNLDEQPQLELIARYIKTNDDITRQVLIRYMDYYSAMNPPEFHDRMIIIEPDLEGDIMTVAQQLIQQGIDRGMQQGMQQGKLKGMQEGKLEGKLEGMQEGLDKGKRETARNMIRLGRFSADDIITITGLDRDTVELLQQEASN